MNERIVKLFMQSVDSKYIPLPIEDHIPSWAEKFAELIVRECCSKLEEMAENYIASAALVIERKMLIEQPFRG